MCFLLISNAFRLSNAGGGVRRRERDAAIERERVVNRQAEKEIVTLLPNVISMQMTDKELRPRRMETVTTATNVAVATEIS